MGLKLGDIVQVHGYKHDKTVHRIWNKVKVLYSDHKMLVVGNNRTKVIEHNGRTWYTREPAICFYFKDYWFNVIAMIKKNGVHFYCNLSSPYIYDGEAIKYIDYDLDVKLYPNGTFQILDEMEYEYHRKLMKYDDKIDFIVKKSMEELIEMIERKEKPFNTNYVLGYYELYKKEGL